MSGEACCDCYLRGMQDAAYDSYSNNILASVRPNDYHIGLAELVRGPAPRPVGDHPRIGWPR